MPRSRFFFFSILLLLHFFVFLLSLPPGLARSFVEVDIFGGFVALWCLVWSLAIARDWQDSEGIFMCGRGIDGPSISMRWARYGCMVSMAK